MDCSRGAVSDGASLASAETKDEDPLLLLVNIAMVKHKAKNANAKIAVMRAIGFFEDCADKMFESVSAELLVKDPASGRCKKMNVTMRMVIRIRSPVKISISISTRQYSNQRSVLQVCLGYPSRGGSAFVNFFCQEPQAADR